MSPLVAFFIPVVVFLLVVAPVWLALHYRSKNRSFDALAREERDELLALSNHAQSMGDRVSTLEAILDDQAPGWRERSPQ